MTKGGKEALILCHLRFLHLEYHHLAPFFCSYFFLSSMLQHVLRSQGPLLFSYFHLSYPPLYANLTSCFDPFQHHKFLRSVMTPIRCHAVNIYAQKEVIQQQMTSALV
jgi:hypothetical protein